MKKREIERERERERMKLFEGRKFIIQYKV